MSRKCDLLGTSPMVGNNVSHAKNRTKRRFMPNLQSMRYFSNCLGIYTKFRICTSTNRTVMLKGGLDSFLLSTDSRKLTEKALKLKKLLLKKIQPTEGVLIRR